MNALSFGFPELEGELWRLVFVMARVGAALLAAPFFGAAAVPAQLRVAVSAALSVLVCAWVPLTVPPALLSLSGILAMLQELLIGTALGFVLQFSFAAPTIAAEQIGGAMGMSIAATADPLSGAHSPALGQYFSVLLATIFLGLGGHLKWFALVVDSYRAFPPGQAWLGPAHFSLIASFAGAMFAAAIAIALPVTLILLLVQLLTGVLSRSSPSLNLFSLGLPAGVMAGIAALIVSAPLVGDRLTQLSADALDQAGAMLAK